MSQYFYVKIRFELESTILELLTTFVIPLHSRIQSRSISRAERCHVPEEEEPLPVC